jgi:hypothetical protein
MDQASQYGQEFFFADLAVSTSRRQLHFDEQFVGHVAGEAWMT